MAFCAISVILVLALDGVQKKRAEREQIEELQSADLNCLTTPANLASRKSLLLTGMMRPGLGSSSLFREVLVAALAQPCASDPKMNRAKAEPPQNE